MKEKIKYTYYHDTDPEKEKVTVVKNKRDINDTTFKAITKIDSNKYTEVIAHDDGNGYNLYIAENVIRVDYFQAVQLHAIMSSIMDDNGNKYWESQYK